MTEGRVAHRNETTLPYTAYTRAATAYARAATVAHIRGATILAVAVLAAGVAACGGDDSSSDGDGSSGNSSTKAATVPGEGPQSWGEGPAAGNPDGTCNVPVEATEADVSSPDHVIGDGTPESCTSDAVVSTVALGGVITFDCGPDPITIEMEETAKIVNDTGPEIVIDGGGKVTLSGMGERRILYMNTCDEAQKWTTPRCQNQDHPRLTVQNLTFVEGNAAGLDPYGGGAVFVRGGRVRFVNDRFFRNSCDETGPDVGGAGIRVLSQYEGRPVYVVNSTFGGDEGYGNACSNGGGISSIGVSWTVLNSLFSHNVATGNGANPAQEGTPGGGSGGAIYNDGNEMTLTVCGSRLSDNTVNAHGGAIFFVSNNRTGNIVIDQTTIENNPGGTWYPQEPGISMHGDTPLEVTDSQISE